jgi:S1-C subfamily serine protease
MNKIIIKHLSGSKAGQVQEFTPDTFTALSFGRAPGSTVQYDERDDLVSREHAKITKPGGDNDTFIITDLNSRNGTYLNKKRILGTASLSPEDIIQLGLGGPEFQFDLDPRPENAAQASGVSDKVAIQMTRKGLDTQASPGSPTGKTFVSRATVERLLSDYQASSRKTLTTLAAAIIGIVIVVAGVALYFNLSTSRTTQPTMTPAEIAKKYGQAVVFIEASWNLIHIISGQQVYHHVLSDPDCQQCLAYVEINGRIHPWLTVDKEARDLPVQGTHTGSGFAVTNNGFILTNRQVAATWNNRWNFPTAHPGRVYSVRPSAAESSGDMLFDVLTSQFRPLTAQDRTNLAAWVPANERYLVEHKPRELFSFMVRDSGVKSFEGRINYLNVTFPNSKLRIPARSVRTSDRHDVALLKIDLPGPIQKIDLYDGHKTIQAGDAVTVLGYPSVLLAAAIPAKPLSEQTVTTATLMVTGGLIGKVVGGIIESTGQFSDVYQLTMNATGLNNNGGPVFDDHGRVIGIFTSSLQADVPISFAVPIRLGRELMDITPGSNQ